MRWTDYMLGRRQRIRSGSKRNILVDLVGGLHNYNVPRFCFYPAYVRHFQPHSLLSLNRLRFHTNDMADTVERRLLSLCLRYLSELLQPYSHDEIPLLRCAKSRLTLWADDFGNAVGLYHTVECATFIKAPATVLLLDFARCLLATFDQCTILPLR